MRVLEVVAGGVQATLQDLGRPGYRALGVPLSGAMDRFALQAANLLLGNLSGAPCVEVLLGGLVLRCNASCAVAVCGADLDARIDGEILEPWTTSLLSPGATLAFTGRRSGARAYLAIAGGFVGNRVLGSCSTYTPGGWGGYVGRPLHAGDCLEVVDPPTDPPVPRWLPPERRPRYSAYPMLRCVVGPHLDAFSANNLEACWGSDYTLSAASDRMGYRLDGPLLPPDGGGGLASLGVLPGCVQVPPHGQPILLMADAQTTGGYPVIATVISADLPLAAQLLPGDCLRLRPVSLDVARAAARSAAADLRTIADPGEEVEGAPV